MMQFLFSKRNPLLVVTWMLLFAGSLHGQLSPRIQIETQLSFNFFITNDDKTLTSDSGSQAQISYEADLLLQGPDDAKVLFSERPASSVPVNERGPQIMIEAKGLRQAKVQFGSSTDTGDLALDAVSPGTYSLIVEATNYYPVKAHVEVRSGYFYKIEVELVPIRGVLDLSTKSGKYTFMVDGEPKQGLVYLTPGDYLVRAREFGYEDFTGLVTVYPQVRTSVVPNLKPAPFRVSNDLASRGSFRPTNAGELGTSTLRFSVSNMGTVILSIFDPLGEVLLTKNFENLTTWDHGFSWDGRDSAGLVLPPGIYSYRVVGIPAEGLPSEGDLTQTSQVIIDDQAYIKVRNQSSHGPGFHAVRDAFVLDGGAVQVGIQSQGSTLSLGGGMSFRLGLGSGFELNLGTEGSVNFDGAESLNPIAFGGLSFAWLSPPAQGGMGSAIILSGKSSFGGEPIPDAGFTLSMPLMLYDKSLQATMEPGISIWIPSGTVVPSLGLGLALDQESWWTSLSGMVAMDLKKAAWWQEYPAQAELAVEGALILGAGPLYLNGGLTLDLQGPGIFLGLGLIH